MRKFILPLVGLGTCYYEFSKEGPDEGVRRYRGGLRRLLETELAMARCEFDKIKGYYAELDMKDPLYLAGVTNCVVGALGRGDLRLFDRILRDLDRFPEVTTLPYAQLGREIALAWIRQFLRVQRGYPEWMTQVNLTRIPDEWKRQCAYLGVKGMLVHKNYAAAYASATMLLNFDSRRDALSAFTTYERIVCAHSCHELGRKEESYFWYRQTAERTCPYGIILPYLLVAARLGPVMGDAIREVSLEAAAKIRNLAPGFFANLIRFHNRFTGGSVTTKLSPQEFYLAQQLADGYSYKEISDKLNVSRSRVNRVVESIYAKLGVHSKDSLRDFVW